MSGSAHRPDIEGLRGVAILSVFAVHSIPDSVRGGFIGVDVFFVLSGFLIASNTLREQAQGIFTVRHFIARRIERLLPALIVVLVACLVFAWAWALPADAMAIGKHVAGGAGFVSNLVLWREGGYFDPGSDTKPLLHLWSLGVEGQFYLLWPLLALLVLKSGRRSIAVVALILLTSFALNIGYVGIKAKAVFFLPMTRMWEMLVGVMLALLEQHLNGGLVGALWRQLGARPAWRQHLPDALSAVGMALLAGSIVLIDKTDRFPGWWAVLPTLGTALILAAGMEAWLNRGWLAHPVLTFYGRISYSLYLWHWPLLVFPVLLAWQLDTSDQIELLILAVGLAVLTTFGIENPLRQHRWRYATPLILLVGMAIAGALGLTLYLTNGLVERYPEPVRTIARDQLGQDPAAVRSGTCFQNSAALRRLNVVRCVDITPMGAPLVALWGDSFAAALYPGLRTAVSESVSKVRLAQFTGPLCPPILRPSALHLKDCQAMNDVALEEIRRLRPRMVLLAGAWLHYSADKGADPDDLPALRDTIRQLQASGVPRVVVIGAVPSWRADQPRLLLAEWQRSRTLPDRTDEGLLPGQVALDDTLRALSVSAGAEFVSALDLLCNAQGCLTTVMQDGVKHPIAYDGAHLTSAASRMLTIRMLDRLTLR